MRRGDGALSALLMRQADTRIEKSGSAPRVRFRMQPLPNEVALLTEQQAVFVARRGGEASYVALGFGDWASIGVEHFA